MKKFILGKKIEMSQMFMDDGKVAPVTLIEAGPVTVKIIRTKERDGYEAVQVSFGKHTREFKPKDITVNSGDTIDVFSTYVTCHSPTTLAFEMAGGNVWGKIKTNWGFTGTNDLDLALLPLIQNNSTGINSVSQKNIFFTNDNSNLVFSEAEVGAELSVINMQGQICKLEVLQNNEVDISQLPSGLYCFFLKNNIAIIQKGKFIHP